jgi:hypothetical protein
LRSILTITSPTYLRCWLAWTIGQIVVIELGDNAGVTPAFAAGYSALLDGTKGRLSLYCLSTWWQQPSQDLMIKAACEAHGGHYVFIGDIYPTRQDARVVYADAAVQAHPNDWSMAMIASPGLGDALKAQ